MAQNLTIGAPELAGFSVLGATAGAALSNWLVSGAESHDAAGCIAGAIVLPLICTAPQWLAALGRWFGRLPQLAGLQLGDDHLAEGDKLA